MINNKIKLGLALLELKGFGRAKARALIESMEQIPNNAGEVIEAINRYVSQTGKKLPEFNDTTLQVAMGSAARIMDHCSENGVIIDFMDSEDERQWVRRYAAVPNPPLMLFSLGDTSIMDMPTIAIIGTRNPTALGRSMAESAARKSVEAGFCVVSGLAMGCDVEAHRSTLENKGKTAAVLAHGLGEVHPIQHTEIAHQIIERGGCLLSEYSPGTPIERGYFVERDRLQSAGSLGVLVIETSITGGSMHTVGFAEKQNRPVACLNHPKKYHNKETVKGNRQLIDKGAMSIWDESSFDNFLNSLKSHSSLTDRREPKQESLI